MSTVQVAVREIRRPASDIGSPGAAGFGVGVCPPSLLPGGFTGLPGHTDKLSDNYGNYQFQDGSIMVWVPKFYYRIGHVDNPTYGAYGVNSVDVKGTTTFSSTAAANAAGYALHRAFIDGGVEQAGFMFDKYQCSKNAWGSGIIASSIKSGNPISTNSAHNPIADLTACSINAYYEAINAAHARDGVDGAVNPNSIFHCASQFQYAALALLSLAHGQAATSATYCAWYDAADTINFPKGCNNNALGDTNDAEVSYTSDGYSNCGKTGSGSPFAKTTHNGQACGVADLNGNMWEISLGLTRDSGNTDFYVLKESVRMRDLTSGSGSGFDAWGNASHLATPYDVLSAAHLGNNSAWSRFGNGANQVLSEALTGNDWLLTALGIYRDANGESSGGTNLFGQDGVYEYHRAELCVRSGAGWYDGSLAGVWAAALNNARGASSDSVGCRAACSFG